ncbi:methyltransferase domain-containing protein [Patescibacteria group bacterium]|nr:methyltransferase domain-containing protein [Patescibacteria group bacterium]
MAQEKAWENEYRKSKLLTKDNKPQSDVVRYVQYLIKQEKIDLENLNILDLGSGAGRNSFYFAEMGNNVIGLEISKTAIEIAKKYFNELMSRTVLDIKYVKQSIGEKFPIDDNSIDIVLDVTSSNSLTETEREVYLQETKRVLKPEGHFFVKALCKDGDDNAKHLLKDFPGVEKDTYKMPGLEVVERVWTKEDFVRTYEPYFNILKLEKKTSYPRMNNRSYKRNFWLAYLQNK